MGARRSRKRKGESTETAVSQMDRLVSASAHVLDDFERQLTAPPNWQIESVLLKAIVNQVPELLYAKDRRGHFIAANDAVARDNGLRRSDDLIGKTDFDLHTPEMAQRFFDIEQRIMASGQPMIDMEERRTDDSGGPKWLLTTKV